MATRTFFRNENEPNVIYSTTHEIKTYFASELPSHQYSETWYLLTVEEQAKKRVEDLFDISIDKYRDEETGRYILGIGDLHDDTGLDIWLGRYDVDICDIAKIKGVTLEEQCTFRGYLDTACPDNTYVIFSRCNGDDWEDTGWEIIDDEELVRHLEEGLANFVWEESSPGVASFDYNGLKVEKSIWDKDTWWESRITINNVQ